GPEPDPLDRPAFAIWQILLAQAGKELDHVRRRLPVGEIVDLRAIARRIGGDVVFQRHGNVDQLACHEQDSLCFKFAGTVPRGRAHASEDITMPAYWVARSKINDPVEYKKYTDLVPAIIAKFGGKVLARGGRYQIMEGPAKFQRFVVIEFPTFEQGVACFTSPEYD